MMNIVEDDEDHVVLAAAQRMFGDEALPRDDIETAKIEDIVTFILEAQHDENLRLKQKLCDKLNVRYVDPLRPENGKQSGHPMPRAMAGNRLNTVHSATARSGSIATR